MAADRRTPRRDPLGDLYLRLYGAVEQETRKIDDQLMAMAYEDGRAKLLMTLPGVAHGVAMSLLAALGDITRFKDGDHAASYLGLTPSLRQSAAKRHHGRITKAGCPQTRGMLTQAAQAAADHPGPIGAFFRRLRRRKRHNVAVIATAKKLVTIAYLMLKSNEPYRYAKLDVVKPKFTACRSKAKPTAAARLNALYRLHGLPTCQTPAEWSTGERRALDQAAVRPFADAAHEPATKTKRRKRAAPAAPVAP